jgi:DNA-binding response OmpR family regulator
MPQQKGVAKLYWQDPMTPEKPTIVIVDDDPSHLQLYGWVIERGGFAVHPVLASGEVDSLGFGAADLLVLDYRLGPMKSIDVARRWMEEFPQRPLILLSDVQWLPDEFTGITKNFVRKGEPQQLIDTISALLQR